MKSDLPPSVDVLLDEALKLSSSERDSFLAAACGDDEALREEVASLIRADEAAGDFLERPLLAGSRARAAPRASALRELAQELEAGVTPDARPSSIRARPPLSRMAAEAVEALDSLELARFARGTMVAGRYRVEMLLGQGGMGEVYRAVDVTLGETVALKFLPEPVARDEAVRSRLLREVRLARKVTHPNVCRVHDVGEADGFPFLSMEYVEGEDLDCRLRRLGRPNGAMAKVLALQLCRGLAGIHDVGVLHRDLKPSNVLIDGEGRARITDFGLAVRAGTVAGSRGCRGTPAYMAPEQFAGGEATVRSDMYALGATLYELFTGCRPFQADTPEELGRLHRERLPEAPGSLVEGLEPAVERMLVRCLEKNPLDRPASAYEVIVALTDRTGISLHSSATSEDSRAACWLHQLPRPPGDFVGREVDLRELREAVENGSALLGLHGMGGVGKTTVALKLAEELTPRYPDAQIYLDLKGTSPEPLTATQAMTHVLRAFSPEAPLPQAPAELAARYRSVLYGRRCLLLMDNAASADQIEPLVPPRGCLLLVTSRRAFALPGLVAGRLDVLPATAARSLLERIEPRIGGDAKVIARLCGNLPLALRLAGGVLAERCDLSPAEYGRRLSGGRERLKLVDASLALSCRLLDAERRRLWCALAVFPGDFDRRAMAAVWDLEPAVAEEVLSDLVKSNLVEWSGGRYRLHDLVRLFVEHRLEAAEEFELRRRHAEHYLEVLRQAERIYSEGGKTSLRNGLDLLEKELANIEAGQAWIAAHSMEAPTYARLCSDYCDSAGTLLFRRLPPRTAIRWRETALASTRLLNDRAAQGTHLRFLGWAYAFSGNPKRALESFEEARGVCREIADRKGEVVSLHGLGWSYISMGEHQHALQVFRTALKTTRQHRDRRSVGKTLGFLGENYLRLGKPGRARALCQQSVEIFRDLGDRGAEGQILLALAETYAYLGDLRYSCELFEQALGIVREVGERRVEIQAVIVMSLNYVDLDNPHLTLELVEGALAIARELDYFDVVGCALYASGRAYSRLGQPSHAISLHEQSLDVARRIGDRDYETKNCWDLGLLYERQGDLPRAAELMQARVDYERHIGHTAAEKSAAKVDEIRRRLEVGSSRAPQTPIS